jgi:hypothetical protein
VGCVAGEVSGGAVKLAAHGHRAASRVRQTCSQAAAVSGVPIASSVRPVGYACTRAAARIDDAVLAHPIDRALFERETWDSLKGQGHPYCPKNLDGH